MYFLTIYLTFFCSFFGVAIICLQFCKCLDQTCTFGTVNWSGNGNDGPNIQLYVCSIANAYLMDDTEMVKTQIASNTRQLEDVQGVLYHGTLDQMKFLPKSIFTLFTNVYYVCVNPNQGLEKLRPEYFKNAKNLKIFKVMTNEIKSLADNVFEEANNLLIISLYDCKIENIHRYAFNGLTKLHRIYLHQNRISTLHPHTFSQLRSLQYVSLSGNTCIDKTFVNCHQNVLEIENEIRKSCNFNLTPEELTNTLKSNEEKLRSSDVLIQDLLKTVNDLQKSMKALEQTCATSTSSNLKQLMQDQRDEIITTCECQHNLIDIRFNDKN